MLYERVNTDKEQKSLKALSRPKPSMQRPPAAGKKTMKNVPAAGVHVNQITRLPESKDRDHAYNQAAPVALSGPSSSFIGGKVRGGNQQVRDLFVVQSSQHSGKDLVKGETVSCSRVSKEKKYGIEVALRPSKEDEVREYQI